MVATTDNASGPPDPAAQAAQVGFVRDQFVALFLRQNKRAQLGLLCSAVLVCVLLLYRVPGYGALLWMAGVLLVSGGRLVYTDRIVGQGAVAPVRIGQLLLLNGVCMALPVAAFAWFSDVERAFVTIVLMATATASVVTTCGYRGLFLWFAAPLLVSLSLAWGVTAGVGGSAWAGPGMGVLIALYLGFLVGLGRDVFRVFDGSCRIRFAENALNQRLTLALEDARLAGQAKTRFLAAASHDLRQPLHTMGVLLAAIGLRPLDTRSREIVQMLGVVSQSLSGQLDGLLDISKLDAGIVQPALKVHRLDQLVQDHVAVQAALAQAKGLYMRAHCPAPVRVLTDAHLLQRVLGNLTSNALKFTAHGGVEVSLVVQHGQAVLAVADTGAGIAPEHLALVFQEFYQVGNAERDRSQGLGLGLAIVQRVCGLLGISLQLESEQGQGSRFTLRLPLADAPQMNAVRADRAADLADPAADPLAAAVPPGMVVLVVDDEVGIRQGMRLLLEELGCSALLADGVAQALAQAHTHKIDMVVSDCRLRHADTGFDVVRQVRDVHPHAYALLISGDTAPDRLQQAQAAGIPLLHKPVTLDALLAHIHQARPPHAPRHL